ncbi:MAG: hypothetical protein JWR77_1468 [Rhizorhabdus sp.]|nr:hypothetical protein [Rhizorhabdus sp.]
MRASTQISCATGIGALAIALGFCSPAQAQTTPAEAATADPLSEEIVVTARRREESAQRVPVAVTALGPVALETRSVRSLTDLTTATPGLRFSGEGNANVSSISLRGLSKIAASSTGTPAVVVYFAEVPMVGEGLNLPTFDLANIQVLKGPQGTLFGRNTIGGAVLVTPQAPTYDVTGYARLSYGNLDYKAAEGAINVPIVADKVAVRLAGQVRRRDGFVQDLTYGARLDNLHQNAFRASLLLQPTETLSNTTIYDYYRSHDDGNANVIFRHNPGVVPDLDPFFAAVLAEQRQLGVHKVRTQVADLFDKTYAWGITNTTRFELGDLTFKNIFGYRENQLETRGNNDGLPAISVGGAVLPITIYKTLHSFNNDRQYSDEFQVQGKALDGKLDFILGAFYVKFGPDGVRGNQNEVFNFFGAAPPVASSTYVHQTTKAIFGQIGYDLSDVVEGLKFNLGARYTWTKQSLCGATLLTVNSLDDFYSEQDCKDLAASGAVGKAVLKAKEHKPTWTVGFDYQAAQNVFLYVSSRRGYREGGINGPIFNSPATLAIGLNRYQTYKPEIVTDVEVGAKTDWRAGDVRGRFNIAAFRNWYDDAVNYINVAGVLATNDPAYPDRGSFGFNAAKLVISGIEVEGTISPTPGMVFSFAGTYLDQNVKSVTTVTPFPPVSVTLPSPKWSYSLGADFTPQAKVFGGDLTFHADFYWMDSYQVQAAVFPGYDVLNARIDLRNIADSHVSVGLFAKNALNNAYLAAPVIALSQFPVNNGNPAEPRTYGLELSYKF